MSIGLEVFRWQCIEGGYEWQDAESLTELQRGVEPDERQKRFLVSRPGAIRARVYQPLVEFPTLFKEFVSLEPGEDAFAAFASKYGMLGVGHLLAKSGPFEIGEPLHRWWEEWSRMRMVVCVLDAIQTNDAKQLESWVEVTETAAKFHITMDSGAQHFGLLANRDDLKPWLWQFALGAASKTEQRARLASGWTQEQINESLTRRNDAEASVTARVLFNGEHRFSLHFVPNSLLAAMWLQCARMLTVNPTFKACQRCGKWFELSPDARRKQSKYCSDRCKVAAYRTRKDNAMEMLSECQIICENLIGHKVSPRWRVRRAAVYKDGGPTEARFECDLEASEKKTDPSMMHMKKLIDVATLYETLRATDGVSAFFPNTTDKVRDLEDLYAAGVPELSESEGPSS